jgi:predicted dehydrogenase
MTEFDENGSTITSRVVEPMQHPPPTRLRAGVVGCGAIAHEHLDHLARSPVVDLVAVCDRSPVARRFAGDRYSVPGVDSDVEELFGRGLDVIHVCTPPATHPDLVVKALDTGHHVICEKPLAPNAVVAAELLDRAQTRGLTLVESQNLRWNDPVLAIDRLIGDGGLGQVREVEIMLSFDLTAGPFGDLNLRGPGVDLPAGAVHDFLPHLSYLFLHFADHDGDVDDVVGRLVNLSANPRVGYDHLDALITAGSVRGHLRVASDLAPDGFRIAVRGTEGGVETDLYQPYLRVQRATDSGIRAPVEQLRSGVKLALASVANASSKVLQHGGYHGIPRMLDAIYGAVQSGAPSPIRSSWILSASQLNDRLAALAEPGSRGQQS